MTRAGMEPRPYGGAGAAPMPGTAALLPNRAGLLPTLSGREQPSRFYLPKVLRSLCLPP